ELVASCCTLLVLAPLAFMPGLGVFLFRPMALAVAFAMIAAYLLSRSFVPVLCYLWLRPHSHPEVGAASRAAPEAVRLGSPDLPEPSVLAEIFARWELFFNGCIAAYLRLLGRVLKRRVLVLAAAGLTVLAVVLGVGSQLRREFFPEV